MSRWEKHPDETSIELYVLGAPMEEEERDRLTAHLDTCPACAQIYSDIREFYVDLDDEPVPGGNRASDLPVPSRRPTPARPSHSAGDPDDRFPARGMVETAIPIRAARWIVRHPVVSTTGGVGLLALLIALLLPAPGFLSTPPDANPVNFHVTGLMMSIVNRSDSVLLSEQVSEGYAGELTQQNNPPGNSNVRLLFVDVDGDGRNEILQVRNPGRPEGVSAADVVLRSSDWKSILWRYPASKHFSFPERTEGNTPDFGVRTVLAGDYDHDGAMEVYVLTVHTHFPSYLAKLDARTGKELGLFLNIGHIHVIQAVDLDGDGISELILGGRNNAFRRAFVAVLDPRRMSGRGPVTGPYTPEKISPAAVESYVLFPRTIIGTAIDDGDLMENVVGISVNRDERYMRVTVTEYNGGRGRASYTVVFDRSMDAINFQTGDNFDALADSLDRGGLLPESVGPAYYKELLTNLRYLKGDGWTTRPLSTRFGQNPASPGTR